jgi:hypothetical protein
MKFKDFLTEKVEKHGVLSYGRFSPPTIGHEKLVNKVQEIAKTVGGTAHVVLSHSQDPKKNPLTPQQKLKHAKRAFPGVNLSVSDSSAPNFLAQAAKLHKAGVTHFHMVGGQDRVDEYYKLLHKYNGVKGPHGSFNFKHITVHSAGDRDPDAEGVEGMSASKMREHATKGNFKEFRKGVPSRMTDAHAKEMYNHVRKGMGLKEDLDVDFEEFLDEAFSLTKTFDFIRKAHKGQKYGNVDYWNHPKSVAFFGKKFFKNKFDDKAMKAALLHDVIEDTPYGDEQLVKMGFEKDVIDAVKLLTKNKSLSYEDNIKKIISSGNKTAMMVKFADNYKNYTGDKSDWPEEKKQLSQKKYKNSLEMLAQKLGVRVPVSESLDEEFEQFLTEGVHDKGIFKAVFLFGGPGSGKDHLLSNTLDGHGLVEINSDKAFEFLMDKNNLDMRMPENERERRDIVRGKAKSMTELRQRLALFGRNGLIINGTGDDVEKISKIKERLENLGYETSGIMVNTADEVSKQRNIERGQRGGRTVPEEIRSDKWQKVQNARPELAKMFGQNYREYDNSDDLRTAEPQIVQQKQQEMINLYKDVQKFVSKPPKNPNAKLWVASELEKKDTLKVDPTKEVTPHEGSKAADQARELGLTYFGFGRYGKNGKVTHRSVHDKLVEVQPQGESNTKMPVPGTSMSRPAKKINEEFEEMLSESMFSDNYAQNLLLLGTQLHTTHNTTTNETLYNHDVQKIVEKKEDKYITDKQGKPRVFMLRAAAAKEAHTKNGTIVKTEKGYLIKLKENEDVQMAERNICEGSSRQGSGSTNNQSFGESSRFDKTSREERRSQTLCEETSVQETPVHQETRKITISEIRKRQEEKITESIDKGIEPGVSMSGSGESVARDTGEKIKKRTGKSSQVTEMTGDETTASIGDQKEDELKKKGISLTSFKKRNFV